MADKLKKLVELSEEMELYDGVSTHPEFGAQAVEADSEQQAFVQWVNHDDGNEAGMTLHDAYSPADLRLIKMGWMARAALSAASIQPAPPRTVPAEWEDFSRARDAEIDPFALWNGA